MPAPAPAVNLAGLSELSTVAEAASFLRMSEATILRRIAAGVLPAVRAGDGPTGFYLVPRQALAAFLADRGAFKPGRARVMA